MARGKTEAFTTEQVIAAIQKGYTPTGAASLLGCHPQTIRRYAKRHPTVKEALLAERRCIVDYAEQGLRAAVIRGDAWAVALALKTLGKNRGYVERQELTGRDGEALVPPRDMVVNIPTEPIEPTEPTEESASA